MLAFLAQDLFMAPHRPDKPRSSLRRYCVLLSYHRFLAPYSVHLLIARPVTTAFFRLISIS
jgi:hypothetical protein